MKKITLVLILIIIFTRTIGVFAYSFPESSIIMEEKTGRILYEKNSHKKMLIASTTKIMTAIITIENTKLTENVKVGKEILKMYGTNIYIDVGEEISIEALLYGLMLRSGNDAAVALANYVAGTEEKFVQLMNEKAKTIGMNNTVFNNPHGLDDDTKNYSTAYDMALLSIYANKNPIYKKITKTKKITIKSNYKTYLWYNRNKLLQQYEYCTGGKNGYTPSAGKTLVTTASKDLLFLTIVTLNDSDSYKTHMNLYEEYFNKYKNYTIVKKGKHYKKDNKIYVASETFSYPMTKEEKKHLYIEITGKNQKYITIKLYEKIIGKIKLNKLEQKKEAKTLLEKFSYLFDNLKKFILGRQNNLNPGPLVPKPLEINNSESSSL
ncbi:MAG: D-alanyl-D-alanine carboxypeptidase [Bacilli bacterium]|nr:D-alanyl-D-alanine carboxypeptidase [Bacilli bacterium]